MINLFTNWIFAAPCPERSFFFFPSWWKYLDGKTDSLGSCRPVVNFPDDVWLIGLAVLDILIRLGGFIAVIMIIVAGIELVISQGNTEKGVAARNRIINALTGLAVVVVAVPVVSFAGTRLGGDQGGNALPHAAANQSAITDTLNIVFVILGALAFLFMVIAGLRLVLSRGDTTKIADARRQIVYAAAGLIIIASASAIVNFVIGRII